jgi:hypothetical protein
MFQFLFPRRIDKINAVEISKFCHLIKGQEPTLNSVNIAPTTKIHTAPLRVLLMVGRYQDRKIGIPLVFSQLVYLSCVYKIETGE